MTTPTFLYFKSFILPDSTRFEHIRKVYRRKLKKIEENWNQSQKDVKKWRCLCSFNLRLKALISEVTVEQHILALVCYVSAALITKIAKRTRISTFDWGHWRALVILHNPIEPPNMAQTYNIIDRHYSLDSEDDFCSGCRNVSLQQQFFSEVPSPGRSHELLVFLGSSHLL